MEDLKDIKIEAKPDYLLVEVGGTFSLEFAFKVIDVSLERSIAHKKNKILYDFRNMAGKITMLDGREAGVTSISQRCNELIRNEKKYAKYLKGRKVAKKMVNNGTSRFEEYWIEQS